MKKVQIIIEGDEPAIFFSSVRAAERYMEPIDVRDGVYKCALGPHGERLDIAIRDERVVLITRPDLDPAPDALRQIVGRYLLQVGVEPDEEEPLSSLLARCDRFVDT